jgi:hypothetical protein
MQTYVKELAGSRPVTNARTQNTTKILLRKRLFENLVKIADKLTSFWRISFEFKCLTVSVK